MRTTLRPSLRRQLSRCAGQWVEVRSFSGWTWHGRLSDPAAAGVLVLRWGAGWWAIPVGWIAWVTPAERGSTAPAERAS